ncbi:hypothetical protein DL546_007194 [Coniochaeta pulveracea]|uniref:Uncharacterized protein n=1 Tax=Coniochaeta pulveracea TaxID=177199 RepID=A0A420YFD8_9PEZI|nr:hypothetical protein DL546_007194 [Coniochaeta pulveracea]
MASLPSQHPSLTLHLADRTTTPIISSAHGTRSSQALTSLTRTALSSHHAATRFNLGHPTRIIVELAAEPSPQPNPSPVVINSFISPAARQEAAKGDGGEPVGEDGADETNGPPLLVGIVIAPDGEGNVKEARRAAGRLERVGKELQAFWVDEGQNGAGGPRE